MRSFLPSNQRGESAYDKKGGRKTVKQRAYELMKTWCDTLFSYQVRTQTPYTDRALLCPACHAVHGRIADLCFPLAVMWDREGDPAYLERADGLIDFSEYNLKTPDGL